MIRAQLRQWLGDARYWVRPFDMLGDRRRWRWQRRTPCSRMLDPAERAVLTELVEDYQKRTGR